ncbi:PaaI family thioesterase [Falsirhodobacter sp. 20TX0035]|uniref:PaaI family thioesterase n=1 Tax=Falsirhodobacter sp. 20TX0035 TaxID=3022019 RepID=UPI002330850C|nr:PaaI family thioesterase [Falsirhodobacter sp. 20TX0035]MDB6452302.1 PaaI family thioesterase [Falsirhodobacter sp. 20TX0035]
MELLDRARHFIAVIPHCAALGITVRDVGSGRATLALPYDRRLIGDPATGVIAGGAVSVLLDSASGAAVMAHPEAEGLTSTIDLRIDYLRAATPGQTILAQAECYHVTQHVAFVRAVTHDDDADRPVAVATGTFTILREGT